MKENTYNTIILGLGAMGSASIYQLSKRGHKVLGIDQLSPPHKLGSSHGDTRITRQAIGEGDQYTPLSLRAYEIFREIERETGKNLLQTTGGLIISSDSIKAINHVADFFDNTVSAARKFNITHEILNAKEIRNRFPQFRVQNNEYAYYEEQAGFLHPEECIEAQLLLAEKYGAIIHRNEKVKSFTENKGSVIVTTDAGVYHTEKLVISAGPWLPQLIDAELKSLFKVHRQVLYWFDVSSSFNSFIPGKFPIFIWEIQGGKQAIYGFPAIDGPAGGLKIASEKYEQIVTPDTVNREVTVAEIESMYKEQVASFFPGIGSKCLKATVCLYTVTADAGFVIDKHPQAPAIIICSPCSGHGFKHSAAIGECIAQLVVDGRTTIDISAFGLSRSAIA